MEYKHPPVVARDKRGVKLAERVCKKCGSIDLVRWYRLREGKCEYCKSCSTKIKFTTHGLTGNPSYKTWLNMKGRCEDPNDISYKRYGAKGIKICDRWQEFGNFFKDMGERPEGCSIDRIDNNVGYEPENCRWATNTEQARNRRVSVWIEYNGKTLHAKDWAYLCNCPYRRFMKRREKGWSMEKILFTPLKGVQNGK